FRHCVGRSSIDRFADDHRGKPITGTAANGGGPARLGGNLRLILGKFYGVIASIAAREHGTRAHHDQAQGHYRSTYDTGGHCWLHEGQAPARASILSCTIWPIGSAPKASSA